MIITTIIIHYLRIIIIIIITTYLRFDQYKSFGVSNKVMIPQVGH